MTAAIRRAAVAAALVLVVAGAAGAAAASGGTGTGGTEARLVGAFTMKGTITVASDVYGEHAGQHVVRSWAFYPQCKRGACQHVVLKRLRSGKKILNTVTLNRGSGRIYRGNGDFWMPLECFNKTYQHAGVAYETITVHITRSVTVGGKHYVTGIRASYDNSTRHQYTRCPGTIGNDAASYAGHMTVKAISATAKAGYLILTPSGQVFPFGSARAHGGDAAGLPFGRHAVGMAIAPSGAGYWIVNSNGGVKGVGVPDKGGLAGKLHHTRAVAIAASGSSGYLILTADGGVHPFGNAQWHGSAKGKLPHGVRAVSLAVSSTGGYWMLTSHGGVYGFGIHSDGSLRGKLHGHRAMEIAADPHGGYLILTGDGGVHPFGKATFYGSDAGKLPKGVSAVSLTLDPKTAGYWLLMSNDGVKGFHAPWKGSLR